MLVTSSLALGNAIRLMREAKGLSKLEAARRCGVGPRFLLEVENGKPTARLDKVLALMAGVGVVAILVPGDATQGMPASG
jgi:transcriptional regulator with XRE-family HTH domain